MPTVGCPHACTELRVTAVLYIIAYRYVELRLTQRTYMQYNYMHYINIATTRCTLISTTTWESISKFDEVSKLAGIDVYIRIWGSPDLSRSV
jgi:hypothetical protein